MVIQIRDKNLIRQLEQLASAEHRSAEQIMADALRLYSARANKISGISFLLSVASQGQSGETDVSTRDEAILKSEINPVTGWSIEQDDVNNS